MIIEVIYKKVAIVLVLQEYQLIKSAIGIEKNEKCGRKHIISVNDLICTIPVDDWHLKSITNIIYVTLIL